MRTTRCWSVKLAAFVLLSLVAAMPVAAAPVTTSSPTLAGESLSGTATKVTFSCVVGQLWRATYTGTASGPFAGTFSATISGKVVRQGQQTALTATFAITSSAGTVRGHATLSGMFACGQRARDAGISFDPASGTYTAKIVTSAGTYHDKGASAITTGFFDLYKGKLSDGSLAESFAAK